MSNHRAALALLMAMSLFCACTLLLRWDEEGLPCDSQGRCSVNHVCSAGRCVALDGGVTCGTKICPVGYACDADAGVGICTPLISPALGHICNDDSNCQASGANRVCLKGAVQSPTSGGVPRTGICVELCGAMDRCMTGNTRCTPFVLGLDAGSAKLCITPRLLVPCVNDDACRDQGMACTLYDHPQVGPLSVCDQPLEGGAQVGQPCVLNTQVSGGQLCGNGLCVPRVPEGAAIARCGELCDRSTCAGGAACRLAELTVSPSGTVRQAPMCQLDAGICKDCSLNPAICGADAPRCTTYGTTKRCLPSCTPDAGTAFAPECPPGYRCELLSGIGPRCTPSSGACP